MWVLKLCSEMCGRLWHLGSADTKGSQKTAEALDRKDKRYLVPRRKEKEWSVIKLRFERQIRKPDSNRSKTYQPPVRVLNSSNT